MTITTSAGPTAPPLPKAKRQSFGQWLKSNGWRHAVAWVAVAFAILPILWVMSAAFTFHPTISNANLIPREPTLANFEALLNNPDQPYVRWYINTMILALLVAFFTVLIGAGAAYAFSRFRFTGRKVGLMFLLLVQMFPQFLALVAIYLIMSNVSDVFPGLGLDSLWGLGLVYLGGAMGINAWLIKGFFDTIPMEIDESAKVDGASHGQIFWGIILPLSAPVLAVVGLLSVIFTINEFVIASSLLQSPETADAGRRTAAVHRREVLGELGSVRRRSTPGGHSCRAPVHLPAEVHRRRTHAGIGEGLVTPLAPHVHHDGSPLYASTLSPNLGDTLALRLRTRLDHQPQHVLLRTVRDGEPHIITATAEAADGTDVWWTAHVVVRNVETHYRWLLVGGAYGFAWLTAEGLVDHDVPDATDFVVSATRPTPEWAPTSVIYQVFPDRFARAKEAGVGQATAPGGAEEPAWAVPRAWTDAPEGRGPNTSREYFGGDLDGVRERLDHMQQLGANVLYMTPVFPAESTHRYDAASFDVVDPLLGGNAALQRLVSEAHRRHMRVLGDITLNHCGRTHPWFIAAQDPDAVEREYFRFDPSLKYGYECWFNVPTLPKFDHTSARLRERLVSSPDSPVRSWLRGPDGLDGWRVDVANMAGRMGSIDVTHEFAKDVRLAMAEERDDALLVAEHGHDASDDLLGDGWHGTMNYAGFTRQVWCWLRGPDFRETFMGLPVEVPVISGQQAVASLRAFHARIPWRSLISSWNILSSHDTARIRTVVGSAERQVAALAMAVGLPGIPMVFAGDEIGLTGRWGEDARKPFPWNDEESWDLGTLDAYRALLGIRAASPALATGGLRWLHVGNDVVAFVREHPEEAILVVAARGQAETVQLALSDLGAADLDHLYGFPATAVAGQAVIEVPSAGAGVWRVKGR